MGLPELLTGQFTFSLQQNKKTTLRINLPEEGKMIITIPSLIAAGIATAVVTGRITGTSVYLTAGDVDVVTGDQIKKEEGLHILELGHMEPWAIAMMCATVLIGKARALSQEPQARQELRPGQGGEAKGPRARQGKRASPYEGTRSGETTGGCPDVPRHAR
jgi:hypothetical protein